MPDNRTITGGLDRTHIALGEDYEVRDWSKKFGITAEALKAAVKAVGNKVSDVETYLSKSRKHG